ncbi:MAG: DUF1972 domain-containing protein [Bryobacterales bacterium]|nr:DUF1972 domain-containing protein [Bryobacterales bacterium]
MRIALLGTRGIPANYGGFETFAEELPARLVKRGHQVTVYCRSHYAMEGLSEFRGAQLVVLPTIRTKHLDTPVHSALSCLHLWTQGADAAIFCNGANAVFTYWPRLLGIPTVLNVDGLERKRKKWGKAARAWYRFSERLATLCPDAVVTDARVIQQYYSERHGLDTQFIAYGASRGTTASMAKVAELGLQEQGYFLYVSRFEPENNALLVVKEFEQSTTDCKLVMVGDAPYSASYIERVKSTQDTRILFPGAVYGTGYRELQSHCLGYVHATEVGGTHPALVEAMARGCPVLYLDTPENREVAGGPGLPFTSGRGSLCARIEELAAADSQSLQDLRDAGVREAKIRYDWETVADAYERILEDIARIPARTRRPRTVVIPTGR